MHKKMLFILLMLPLILTGCWDKVEIDQKSFISTIGIDVGKDISKTDELKGTTPEEPFQERDIKKIKVTYGFPDISQLGPGKGGTAKEKFVTIDAYSMEDAVSKAAIKNSRSIHFGHTKLLILSQSILQYEDTMKEIIDYLERQPSLNRNMQVVVVGGEVEQYVKYSPNTEKNIEAYIEGLMENSGRNGAILPVDLNQFLRLLDENGNAIVPALKINEDTKELEIFGVALIKGYKLKGYLGPVETSDLQMLRGKLKGGKKVIYVEGHPVDIGIEGVERKIKTTMVEGRLHADFNIRLEGQLKDFYTDKKENSVEQTNELQKKFNQSLSEECEKVARYTQVDLEMDPIGLREYIHRYNTKLWKQVESNWDDVYKDAEITVNVETQIRRVGVKK